jgi:recombinational DNA repair ATPase RecF
VLVLDDVLSELDPRRASALMGLLPDGQIVITTAGTIPAAATPELIVHIERGRIVPT